MSPFAGKPPATFSLSTPLPGAPRAATSDPGSSSGAIAILRVCGDVAWALQALNLRSVVPGRAALRSVLGVDSCLVVQWSAGCLDIMPHAGPKVLADLMAAMQRAGLGEAAGCEHGVPGDCAVDPAATSALESHMLAAVARAASPAAIDALLAQPALWHTAIKAALQNGCTSIDEAIGLLSADAEVAAHSRVMNRLVDPPFVVALGRANIGKSSLLNVLAGEAVTLVADEPGTTRDHVGASVNLGGIVVRWVDLPGIGREDELAYAARYPRRPAIAGASEPANDTAHTLRSVERAAQLRALEFARTADLVLFCGDYLHPPLAPHPDSPSSLQTPPPNAIRVALRTDLGRPAWPYDIAVSSATGDGLPALVRLIAERLAPSEARGSQRLWRFW